MNNHRKNASVCVLTSDSIYVFGGAKKDGSLSDSIEMYLVSADLWLLLQVKLPSPIAFATAFKVSQFQIVLLGGLISADSENCQTYPTNQVVSYDIRKHQCFRAQRLQKDFVSIYPSFYNDDGTLLLINEDGKGDRPEIITYDINRYLTDPTNTLTTESDI